MSRRVQRPTRKRKDSDSGPQRRAEKAALARMARRLHVPSLEPNVTLQAGEGRAVLDGLYVGPHRVVMVEVNAHVGPLKSAQRHKVLSDAFKLAMVSKLYAHRWRNRSIERILVFVDEGPLARLGPATWAGAALDAAGVSAQVCRCSSREREALMFAQKRQDIRNG